MLENLTSYRIGITIYQNEKIIAYQHKYFTLNELYRFIFKNYYKILKINNLIYIGFTCKENLFKVSSSSYKLTTTLNLNNCLQEILKNKYFCHFNILLKEKNYERNISQLV